MSNTLENINSLLEKHQLADRHSLFQLKYFVIGKEPTIQAQLWRCIREMQARKESIEAIKMEIEDLGDTLQLLKIKSDPTNRNEIEIAIEQRKKERKIMATEKQIQALMSKLNNIETEASFFAKTFEAIEANGEKMKPFDDIDAQTQYWNEKMTQELEMRLLLGQPIDPELAKGILAMDDRATVKIKLLNIIETVSKQKQALSRGTMKLLDQRD